MSVTPRGSSWLARVSFRGQRHAQSFPTRELAQDWHDTALAALQAGKRPPAVDGTPAPEAPKGITLEAALSLTARTRWAESKPKALAKAQARARLVLADLGADTVVETITTRRIMEWQADLSARGNDGPTINRKVSTLGALMRAVSDASGGEWQPPRFPKRNKENPGRETILSPEEIKATAALLRKAEGSRTTADLVEVMFWTGLRLGEALAQRWSDVHLDSKPAAWLQVRAGDAKTGPPGDPLRERRPPPTATRLRRRDPATPRLRGRQSFTTHLRSRAVLVYWKRS